MISALSHFQITLNRLFDNCLKLHWHYISQNWTHQKKLLSKSSALLVLIQLSLFITTNIFDGSATKLFIHGNINLTVPLMNHFIKAMYSANFFSKLNITPSYNIFTWHGFNCHSDQICIAISKKVSVVSSKCGNQSIPLHSYGYFV